MKQRVKSFFVLPTLAAVSGLALTGRVAAQTLTSLYDFTGGSDGAQPFAGLVLATNTLYGTTLLDGIAGHGTVFAVHADGSGFRTLYSFSASGDGLYPQSTLLPSGNTLYGTTHYGGGANNGTVFALNTGGSAFATLHNFTTSPGQTNSDGANPAAGLILSGGTLYGTAVYGGNSGYGTVFALNTNGTGFTALHTFSALSGSSQTNSDGANPYGGLVLSGKSLYGTTELGGDSGLGTVFVMNADGTGFKTLHAFMGGPNEGARPLAGLILSGNTLYGTTLQGGSSDRGTVFALNTDGSGFETKHSFSGGNDGADPVANLLLAGNTLYGTTSYGGTFNQGTVFTLGIDGGSYSTLHSFTETSGALSANNDGATPRAGLILSGNALLGTTQSGGTSGNGALFSLSLAPITQPPLLAITRSGTDVILTWPANATGFTLQSTTNLFSATTWTTVSPAPVIVNAQNTVTNPLSGAQQFYRLR
jgi:uncharacterized repeat protein (TIGR03803 family)